MFFGNDRLNNMELSTFLYAGNMPFDVTPKLLEEKFSTVGTVKEVKIAKNANGIFMGYAFVGMNNKEEAARAIEKLQDAEILGESQAGRKMYLEAAEANKDLWERAFGPLG